MILDNGTVMRQTVSRRGSYTRKEPLATLMSDSENVNQDSAQQPVTASESDLSDDLDKLLEDVEALTDEALAAPATGEPKGSKPDGDSVPSRDPAKEVIADDVGLSAESPLIQDGEKTPVEEVVANVDQELDRMEKLIGGLGASTSAEDTASDSPIPDIPQSPDDTSAANPRLSAEEVDRLEADANEVDPLETSGRSEADGSAQPAPESSERSEPEQLAGANKEIAGQIPAALEEVASGSSEGEKALDDDIEALLASQEPEQVEPPAGAEIDADSLERPTPDAPEPPPPSQDRADQGETSESVDLESVQIWPLIKLRLAAKSKRALQQVCQKLAGGLVRLLERFDSLIGDRVPPMTRELIGYCALATLAVSVIALLVALF